MTKRDITLAELLQGGKQATLIKQAYELLQPNSQFNAYTLTIASAAQRLCEFDHTSYTYRDLAAWSNYVTQWINGTTLWTNDYGRKIYYFSVSIDGRIFATQEDK